MESSGDYMLEVVSYPNRILKKPTKNITVFDLDLVVFVDDMFETMYDHKGIGLAANQVGSDISLLVMDCGNDPFVMINPEVVDKSRETIKMLEGCLSFGGFEVEIERPKEICVKYQNICGKIEEDKFEGLKARVAAHEIDHLNGITFLKYLSKIHRNLIESKIRKINKRKAFINER